MRNPLVEALQRRPKGRTEPESERIFQIQKEDIQSDYSPIPGDNTKFLVHGKVKEAGDDGGFTMHVHRVEHQREDDIASKPKKISVETQESHAP